MITLDKFGCLSIPIFNDSDDPRFPAWKKQWDGYRDFSKLDRICATEAELNTLMSPLESTDECTAMLVEKPALREFEVVATEKGSPYLTVVRYKKSVLPKTPVHYDTGKGYVMEITPVVDMYISLRDANEVDTICTVFTFHVNSADSKNILTGTLTKEMWRSEAFYEIFPLTEESMSSPRYAEFVEVQRGMKLIYIAVQSAMYNKPTVFTKTASRRVSTHSSKEGKRRNKVKVVKTISLNSEELKSYTASHRHIECPCWGVIGHWRTYKSGKKVWIEPYKKGRERKNPSAYKPKDYAMEVSL